MRSEEIAGGWAWAVLIGSYRFAHRFKLHGGLLQCRCGRLKPRPVQPDKLPLEDPGATPHCSSCEAFP